MAISDTKVLKSILTTKFWGSSYLSDPAGLVADLNTVITKVNSIIQGQLTLGYLALGELAYNYGGASGRAWLLFDGVNPPTVAAMRFEDTDTGAFFDVTVKNGVVTVSAA